MLCKTTNKKIYQSEAAASRKVHQWQDIKRYYFCHSCDGYHISSKTRLEVMLACMRRGKLTAVQAAEKIERVNKPTIEISEVEQRINELKNKSHEM